MSAENTQQSTSFPKLTIFLGFTTVVASIFATWFAFKSSSASTELNRIQALAQDVDAIVEDGALIIFAPRGDLSDPDFLRVLPVFVDEDMEPTPGHTIDLIVNAGVRSEDNTRIKFSRISDRICEMPSNSPLCVSSKHRLFGLEVTYSVQGYPDSARIQINS